MIRIRAILGTDARLNAIFGSATESAAEREIELLLGPESKALVMPLQESQLSGTTAAPLKTVAVIKPDLVQAGKVDQIVEKILCRGYTIVAREEVVLNTETASELYDYWKDEPFFAELVSFMTSGPAVALVIKGEDVIGGWLEMMGNNDPEIAKNEAPSSLRAIYGTDTIHNAVHGSNSPEDAIHEIQLLFPRVIKKSSRTGSINFGTRPSSGLKALIGTEPNAADVAGRLENISNKTLALIKPDAYGSGKKDDILARVKEAGFNVLLEAEIQFSEERAGEFYKEHAEKPFYKDLTTWMSRYSLFLLFSAYF